MVSELSVHAPLLVGVFSEPMLLKMKPECNGSGHQEREKRVFYNKQRQHHAKRTCARDMLVSWWPGSRE